MTNAVCPLCGKAYSIPSSRGKEMVVTKFLSHKDSCILPLEDEFVKVGGRVGIVIESQVGKDSFPMYEIQMPSGRSNVFRASEVSRIDDQDHGRLKFYE